MMVPVQTAEVHFVFGIIQMSAFTNVENAEQKAHFRMTVHAQNAEAQSAFGTMRPERMVYGKNPGGKEGLKWPRS